MSSARPGIPCECPRPAVTLEASFNQFISLRSEQDAEQERRGTNRARNEGQYQGEGATHGSAGLMDDSSAVEDMSDYGGHGGSERAGRGEDFCSTPDLLEPGEDRDTLVGAIHSLEKTIAGHCHLLNRVKTRGGKDKGGSFMGKPPRKDSAPGLVASNSRPQLATLSSPANPIISASRSAMRGDKVSTLRIPLYLALPSSFAVSLFLPLLVFLSLCCLLLETRSFSYVVIFFCK